jgi:hypothetical protein
MNPPDEFRCPITMEVMTDPVIGEDGHTYERTAITQALRVKAASPMTRQPMTMSGLRPNHAIRSAIQRWRTPSVSPVPSAPPVPSAATHTEYVLLITPETRAEQERLLSKPTTTTTVSPATLDEHRRRMCRAGLVMCLFIVVLIFVFHAMAN